ncbi:MAG: hypothetical protein V5A37_01760 [Halobacteriales archaeon]
MGVAPADAAANRQVALTVTVTDGLGHPFEDVTVTARWEGGEASVTTASNGMVIIDVPQGETVELSEQRQGYVRNHPVDVENATAREGDVTMYRRAEGTVTGWKPDPTPVTEANVTLYRRDSVAVTGSTGEDGQFETGVVERREYRLAAVKPGFYENEMTVTLTDGPSIPGRISQGSVVVTFSVADDHFPPPEPFENAAVRIEGVGVLKTSADGTQTAAVPVNTELSIRVTKDGYRTASRTVAVGESPREFAFTVTREAALEVTPDNEQIVAGTTVRLTVTDEYGDPVSGALVTVDGGEAGETDDDGVLRVTLEEVGEHDLAARKAGVDSDPVTVDAVRPAGETTATPTDTPTRTETDTQTATDENSSDPGFGLPAAAGGTGGRCRPVVPANVRLISAGSPDAPVGNGSPDAPVGNGGVTLLSATAA